MTTDNPLRGGTLDRKKPVPVAQPDDLQATADLYNRRPATRGMGWFWRVVTIKAPTTGQPVRQLDRLEGHQAEDAWKARDKLIAERKKITGAKP